MPTDHYATLKVERTASDEDIKKAYRHLVRTTHPDVEGGSAEAFREVQEAYEVLKDPVQRRNYDYVLSHSGASGFRTNPAYAQPSGPSQMPPQFRQYAEQVLREQMMRAEQERRAQAQRLAQMQGDLDRLKYASFPYSTVRGLSRVLGEVYSAHRAAGVPFKQVSAWRRTDSIVGTLILIAMVAVLVIGIATAVVGAQSPSSSGLMILGSWVVGVFLMLTQLVVSNIYRFVNYAIPNRTAR